MKINDWLILGIVFVLLAIVWDESRAGTVEEEHPICQAYGEFTFTVAEARDAGMPMEQVLEMIDQSQPLLVDIIHFVYEAETDALTTARDVYRICMSQRVTE